MPIDRAFFTIQQQEFGKHQSACRPQAVRFANPDDFYRRPWIFMSRRRITAPLFPDPMGWLRVATHFTEMMQSSTQVIARRAALMSTMGPIPSAANQRELDAMVHEKVDAAVESAAAMASKASELGGTAAADLARRMLTAYTTLWSWPTTGRVAAYVPLKGSKTAAAAMVDAGMGPYRRRSRKNAKRLQKI